jgi:hypothetical protein
VLVAVGVLVGVAVNVGVAVLVGVGGIGVHQAGGSARIVTSLMRNPQRCAVWKSRSTPQPSQSSRGTSTLAAQSATRKGPSTLVSSSCSQTRRLMSPARTRAIAPMHSGQGVMSCTWRR